MIARLAWGIAGYLVRRGVVAAEDAEIYAFGFECRLSDTIQWTLLVAAGLATGRLPGVLAYSLGFTFIKKHIGGWHAAGHCSCFVLTTATAVLSDLLCGFLSWRFVFVLLPCALGLIFALAPVEHINNPKTAQERARGKGIARRRALVAAFAAALLTATPLRDLAVYAACGLLAAGVSLILPMRGGERDES